MSDKLGGTLMRATGGPDTTGRRPSAKPDGRPAVFVSPRVRLHYTRGVMYAIIERGEMTIMRPLYWSKR